MSRSFALAFAFTLTFAGPALAGRPPEAIVREQNEAEAEVNDLERRARSLDDQTAERDKRLKRRLRALYKLSSGGYLRLLAGAEDPGALAAREAAVARIVKRDLEELSAVRDEARTVDEDHARRAERLAHALQLSTEARTAESEAPTGLLQQLGKLVRPVPGPVVGSFGMARDPELKELVSRRGVELEARRGEPVRACAAGRVAWIGDVPGLGRGVAVDHGDGYLTLTARLRSTKLTEGDLVSSGATLGEAAGKTLYFELAQGGTPIDPAAWLAR
jgi:septal ring factor EnvC (AmiA/AmiB activator)